MHKTIVCLSCEAEFIIKHTMDDDHYRVEYCPFCAEQIDDEETFHFDPDEEE